MDIKRMLLFCIVFGVIDVISSFFHKKLQEREGKKVNYECTKCQAWDCPVKVCKKNMGA